MDDRTIKSHLQVLLLAEPARCDEGINMLCGLRQQSKVAPPLERTLVDERANGALGPVTGRAIVLEEHVGRTHEPVLMHGVEFNGVAVLQDLGSTHKRDVVIMDNIKTLFQNFADVRGLE